MLPIRWVMCFVATLGHYRCKKYGSDFYILHVFTKFVANLI